MKLTNDLGTVTKSDALKLNAIGDAIFAEWYPHHRPGDPVPAVPPHHIMQEAREPALRHPMVAARARR